jgi:hypothetical protein
MSKPHTCKPCEVCKGKGHFYVSFGGEVSPFMCEDTDESESCDWCEGTGREGDCDRCHELQFEEDDAA